MYDSCLPLMPSAYGHLRFTCSLRERRQTAGRHVSPPILSLGGVRESFESFRLTVTGGVPQIR